MQPIAASVSQRWQDAARFGIGPNPTAPVPVPGPPRSPTPPGPASCTELAAERDISNPFKASTPRGVDTNPFLSSSPGGGASNPFLAPSSNGSFGGGPSGSATPSAIDALRRGGGGGGGGAAGAGVHESAGSFTHSLLKGAGARGAAGGGGGLGEGNAAAAEVLGSLLEGAAQVGGGLLWGGWGCWRGDVGLRIRGHGERWVRAVKGSEAAAERAGCWRP